ncbi:MAG TPA: SpoIIE family protein phosphatase [Chthoniobacterales bacterium]
MADSSKETPLAKFRHDLRTPINHILGYSELIHEELADAGNTGHSEDLLKIRGAAQSLLEQIGQNLTPDGIQRLLAGEPAAAVAAPSGEKPALANDAGWVDAEAAIRGRILVVDDNAENRETLARRLRRQGHEARESPDGRHALELLRSESFDLVLLDVIMPEVDGYTVLREIKADEALRDLPVIMISALDELDVVVRCIQAGAEDYLPKPFEPTLLRARIGAGLEKKFLHDQEKQYLERIEETQQRLNAELDEAANYVRSILPAPMTEPFRIDWRFIPSTELGGDSFGYHWLDGEHFAIYLLDVCGHGVGAALLSVTAINVLRSGALGDADFHDPARVLGALNETFPMEKQNNMYFTMWYGVYHVPTRTLRHASGGHPPALLVTGDGEARPIASQGTLIGVLPGMTFKSATDVIPEGGRLFLLSDGTYEVKNPDGSMLDYEVFRKFMGDNGGAPDALDRLTGWIRSLNGEGPLDDDFSIVSFDLAPGAKIEFQIRNHFDELPALSEKVTGFLQSHGAGGEAEFAANLAIEELVTNLVKYGYDDQKEHAICIRLSLEKDALHLEIVDDGHEFNPFELPEPDTSLPAEEREIGGLGIHFVRHLLDHCEYRRENGMNRLSLRKNLTR